GVELYNEHPTKFGCYTTGKSKLVTCMQMKNLVERINNGLKVNSETLLFELKNFVSRGGSYEAKPGATDDTIMALAVVMKLMNRLSHYDDKARELVYETMAPDADETEPNFDHFGGDPVPFSIL